MHSRLRSMIATLCLAAVLAVPPGGAHAQTLYWIDTNFAAPTLNRSDVNGGNRVSIALTPGSLPEGLTFDPGLAKLYWVESAWTDARLMQANVDFSNRTQVLANESCGRGVTVDPITHEIYWTTSNLVAGSAVRKANADGTAKQSLLSLGPANNPRGLDVDAPSQRMFWADFDLDCIRRSSTTTPVANTIVALPANSGPYGVDFAPQNSQVYWTEYSTGQIRRSTPDGAIVTTVLTGLHNPTYLAVDYPGNRIYWIEAMAGGQKIRSAHLDGTGVVNLPPPIATYGGIAVYPAAPVGVDPVALPAEFALESVAPNPAAGIATIAYALPREAAVRLSVLDVQGREVATLVDGVEPAGRRTVTWNGDGADGRVVAAGLYFVRFQAAGKAWSRRVVMTK